jgi:uncharacterized glyoxalase superfamily metalloenzyme YdcJ
MPRSPFMPPDDIRAMFSASMSNMYRAEVPAYGTLIDLVQTINAEFLAAHPAVQRDLKQSGGLDRVSEERHGAIRLGTATELHFMRRIFAVMGMHPVGYYDLTEAGLPVHATAFRPVSNEALKRNPFRVFTSLLRLDLLEDAELRLVAEKTLAARDIFTGEARRLVQLAETQGGLEPMQAEAFIQETLKTFSWHDHAMVPIELYERLLAAHRLVADVVSFKGPHINHLTPRTLDIQEVQRRMPLAGIEPKETIEGPPELANAILLRQTSFKAIEEPIRFKSGNGQWATGTHAARFGEIEQRGIALTPKGRKLYDELLNEARQKGEHLPATKREDILASVFKRFPDDLQTLRRDKLAYFKYVLTSAPSPRTDDLSINADIESLMDSGVIACHPIVYEDFLPVSAAGIFRSNLAGNNAHVFAASPNQRAFEAALGASIANEFSLYAAIEQQSKDNVLRGLSTASMSRGAP